MACIKQGWGDGNAVIVCGRRGIQSHPQTCETKACGGKATIQCDYPVRRAGKVTTCDRWQCKDCAKEVGPNVHLCKMHVGEGPPTL
jgi:hypothetical protein